MDTENAIANKTPQLLHFTFQNPIIPFHSPPGAPRPTRPPARPPARPSVALDSMSLSHTLCNGMKPEHYSRITNPATSATTGPSIHAFLHTTIHDPLTLQSTQKKKTPGILTPPRELLFPRV
jgi:hypothetical protein